MNKELKTKIGYDVKDELLTEALTHRSYVNEMRDLKIHHNERLEFIGDAVLELMVTEFLFMKYPQLSEGTLTSYRAALVKTESLAEESRRFGIGKFILMSKGEEQTGGRDRTYILANTFEAIIGSIYLSLGYEAAKDFITLNICYKIDEIVKSRGDIDSKSRLQELSQESVKVTPTYELLDSEGPDHEKIFNMAVLIGDHQFGSGKGKSKQEAQQNAASEALDNWEKLFKKFFESQ